MNYWGFAAGLSTALCWTFTSLCFEQAGRRLGSLALNLIRLLFALIFYMILSAVLTGSLFPVNAGKEAWIWLSASGLIGFVLGDIMLFEAFVLIGARLSMLVYAASPVITAAVGFVFLGERISVSSAAGILLTVAGIALATMGRPAQPTDAASQRYNPKDRTLGILLALGGAVGQALGLILGKHGSAGMGSFAASQIRVIAGVVGFAVIIVCTRKTADFVRPFTAAFGTIKTDVLSGMSNGISHSALRRRYRTGLGFAVLGSAFGPFLGVSLGLLSAQLLSTGVASTLMAIVPILAIPVSIIAFKERVTILETVGAFIAVAGVAFLAF